MQARRVEGPATVRPATKSSCCDKRFVSLHAWNRAHRSAMLFSKDEGSDRRDGLMLTTGRDRPVAGEDQGLARVRVRLEWFLRPLLQGDSLLALR